MNLNPNFEDFYHVKKPMDRLICGDVGFGKTEIAMRAALYDNVIWLSSCYDLSKSFVSKSTYKNFFKRFLKFNYKTEVI